MTANQDYIRKYIIRRLTTSRNHIVDFRKRLENVDDAFSAFSNSKTAFKHAARIHVCQTLLIRMDEGGNLLKFSRVQVNSLANHLIAIAESQIDLLTRFVLSEYADIIDELESL